MDGERKILGKRKSSPIRPKTAGFPLRLKDDEDRSVSTSIQEIGGKLTDNNRTKKNVLFRGKEANNSKSKSTVTPGDDGKENRFSQTDQGARSRHQSARKVRSNGLSNASSSESDSPPRSLNTSKRRSVSAHPTLRSQNGVTQSMTKSPVIGSPIKSSLSPRNSNSDSDPPLSSRSSQRSKQRIDRLKLSSPSIDSYDSDDESLRSSIGLRPSSRHTDSRHTISADDAASLGFLVEQNKQAWNNFSNHVKLIDDSTGLISRNPRKTFASSSVFQKAMTDLYGNPEYGKSRGFMKLRNRVGAIASCASKLLAGARRANVEVKQEVEDDDFLDDMDDVGPSKETIENARRGWKIIRQYVQDKAAEKRMSQSTLTWNMLRHTIRGLSNMERTRYELYQRYGLIPTVLSDGRVVQENTMLSERTRALMAAKSASGRPTPQSPPPRHRSASVAVRRQMNSSLGSSKPNRGLKSAIGRTAAT